MKKKFFMRCAVGAAVGLAFSNIIAIIISAAIGDGYFHAVPPELTADLGSELTAVLVQSVCSLVYGAALTGASVIWDKDSWSLLRQTVTHFAVCSAAVFPTAYFMRWTERSAAGIISYFAVFFGIYLAIWIFQYFAARRRVAMMNSKLKENNME